MAVATPERERLRLELDGMTCASCAARIERRLNKLDGVEATVNYATEEASVSFDPVAVSVDDLIATVEAVGYHAALPTEPYDAPDAALAVRTRLVVALGLTAPAAQDVDGEEDAHDDQQAAHDDGDRSGADRPAGDRTLRQQQRRDDIADGVAQDRDRRAQHLHQQAADRRADDLRCGRGRFLLGIGVEQPALFDQGRHVGEVRAVEHQAAGHHDEHHHQQLGERETADPGRDRDAQE